MQSIMLKARKQTFHTIKCVLTRMKSLIAIFSTAFYFLPCGANENIRCDSLLNGQYLCSPPVIDSSTQQPFDCTKDNLATVTCKPIYNLDCQTLSPNGTFQKKIPCRFTSGKDWRTALLLSIFLGWLGVDRFYLGYIASGLFKLFTFGFFFIFHLIDIILIALQIVGPADGTAYFIDYYGPKALYNGYNNSLTAIKPP